MEDRIETIKQGEFIVINTTDKCRKRIDSIIESGVVVYLNSQELIDAINLAVREGFYTVREPKLIEKEYCFMSFDATGKEAAKLSLLEQYIKSKII